MGKLRRNRAKYHFSSKDENEINENQVHSSNNVLNFKVTVPDDLFKTVNIDVNSFNQNLTTDDDTKSYKSVKSISKSIKSFKKRLGSVHLKKNEIRKLRQNLLMKRLNLSYDDKSKKKQKSSLLSISEMDKHLPSVDMVFHKPTTKVKVPAEEVPRAAAKPKGIMKAKHRKKAMQNNLNEFKKLLSQPNFKSNPMDALTSCIEEKVFNEVM